jgi:hypothetical protein
MKTYCHPLSFRSIAKIAEPGIDVGLRAADHNLFTGTESLATQQMAFEVRDNRPIAMIFAS